MGWKFSRDMHLEKLLTEERSLYLVTNRAYGRMLTHAVAEVLHIRREESDDRLNPLVEFVAPYCPVDSPIRAAVSDYIVTWERLE